MSPQKFLKIQFKSSQVTTVNLKLEKLEFTLNSPCINAQFFSERSYPCICTIDSVCSWHGQFQGKRNWNTKVIFLSQKKINFTHLFWIICKQPKAVFAEDIWLSPNHKNFESLQIIYALRRTVSQIKYE